MCVKPIWEMNRVMLKLEDISTFYGLSQVLFGVSLHIKQGEAVTLMGRNGMGKTTTIRSIMGLTPARSGKIVFQGEDITACRPYQIVRKGLAIVPEGRRIFPNLSVHENLVATARPRKGAASQWDLKSIYELFPRLAERAGQMGASLSGGEQQMLAIGRALMTNPDLLILDEASEGLAPLIRDEIWQCLETLKGQGQSILVIDKNIKALNTFASRHHIMEKGRIVWTGTPAELESDPELGHRLLGV